MFEFMAILSAVLGFVGGMKQASALKKSASMEQAAAEESRRIAQRNAAAIEAETAESLRRERAEAQSRQELSKARAAAAGGVGGSTGLYIDEMTKSDDQYLAWLERSGASRSDIARREGDYSYLTGMAGAQGTRASATAAKYGAFGSLVGGGMDAYSFYRNR